MRSLAFQISGYHSVWFECVTQNSCVGNLIPNVTVLRNGSSKSSALKNEVISLFQEPSSHCRSGFWIKQWICPLSSLTPIPLLPCLSFYLSHPPFSLSLSLALVNFIFCRNWYYSWKEGPHLCRPLHLGPCSFPSSKNSASVLSALPVPVSML